jgi:primase-polymerase (primpol)-like protein
MRDGKPTKVPQRVDGYNAAVDNPATWTTFAQAAAAHAAGIGSGLGFVLGDGVLGIDLDHVRDPQTGAIVEWARDVLADLNTWCHISPSETGAHAFCLATKPPGSRSNIRFPDGSAFEWYSAGRFFTINGNTLTGCPPELAHVSDDMLAELYQSMLARRPQRPQTAPPAMRSPQPVDDLNDRELLERMFRSRNGNVLAALWHGNFEGFPSQSEADIRLVSALVFWTGRDPARVDYLFRQSGLMREKWDSPRPFGTYGAVTIGIAISNCTVAFGDGGR